MAGSVIVELRSKHLLHRFEMNWSYRIFSVSILLYHNILCTYVIILRPESSLWYFYTFQKSKVASLELQFWSLVPEPFNFRECFEVSLVTEFWTKIAVDHWLVTTENYLWVISEWFREGFLKIYPAKLCSTIINQLGSQTWFLSDFWFAFSCLQFRFWKLGDSWVLKYWVRLAWEQALS